MTVEPVATAMVVVLTYWLSFEYVRDPRNALEPESAGAALLRGAFHVLSLLSPYLEPASARAPARAGRPATEKETDDMAHWTAFPHDGADYTFDAAALKKHWARLHAGDAEPLPDRRQGARRVEPCSMPANSRKRPRPGSRRWRAAGITVANKAQSIYANYLEKSEKTKLALFMEVAERAEAQAAAE